MGICRCVDGILSLEKGNLLVGICWIILVGSCSWEMQFVSGDLSVVEGCGSF